jgi:hypothetical protein
LRKSAGTERTKRNLLSITGEEQSSEGRSPRALGAERGFPGFRELKRSHEEGSQTLNMELPRSRVMTFRTLSQTRGSEKKGSEVRKC